jgi:parallel beta-helix repeat protein
MRLIRLVSVLALAAAGVAAQVPIKSLPFVIEKPGSYFMPRTLASVDGAGGIIVAASNVSIDLNGSALLGRSTEGDGISIRGPQLNVAISNGTISGWMGIGVSADDAHNMLLSDLRVGGNGMCGVRAGHGAIITNVVAQANGGSGIVGAEALVVTGVTSTGNGAWGLEAGYGSVLTGNSIVGNLGGGIFLEAEGRVTGNTVVDNGHFAPEGGSPCGAATLAGIAVLGSGGLVSDNTVLSNEIGLQLMSEGNRVSGNVVMKNVTDYQFAPGNQLELLVSQLPLRVEWPAVLTLAGTLSGVEGQSGLTVAADDVTIDLLGHGLLGAGGTTGILVDGAHTGLVVRNGFVKGWVALGIDARTATGAHFEDLILEANDVQGLRTGDSSVVRDSIFTKNLKDGLLTGMDCMVLSCTATGNGNDGLHVGDHCQVLDSTASENYLFGIHLGMGSEVRQTTASHNNMGISATDGCTVADCTASFNTTVGIRSDKGSIITANACHDNETGIAVVEGPGTSVTHNNVSHNATGIVLASPGNIGYCNTASGNQTNFTVVAGNAMARIYDVAGDPDFWITDAWANFSY